MSFLSFRDVTYTAEAAGLFIASDQLTALDNKVEQ